MTEKNILITGAGGYIGSQFLKKCQELKTKEGAFNNIVALDIKDPREKLEGVIYKKADIRSAEIETILIEYKVNMVMHLAAILTSAGNGNRDLEFDVDVNGTKKLVDSFVKNKGVKFITTSSGAAYGYRPRNINYWLKESDALMGNYEVPYAYHKMLVEEYLEEVREKHPETQIYIIRPATVIGAGTRNQITDLFTKKKILKLVGYDSPFVFIWDEDLVNILLKACFDGKPGVYNAAGDGAVTMHEAAKILGKGILPIPVPLLKGVFSILHPLKLSKHGPKAVSFIQYRTVLSNEKLKREFAFTPAKTTLETFKFFIEKNKDYVYPTQKK